MRLSAHLPFFTIGVCWPSGGSPGRAVWGWGAAACAVGRGMGSMVAARSGASPARPLARVGVWCVPTGFTPGG